ncbi:MAG: hypothetical protein WC497_05505 [Patescibacteria group bacterium]
MIWVIGMLFTYGLTMVDDKTEDTWAHALKLMLSVTLLWPLLLGVFVAMAMKESDKEKK